MAWFYLPSVEEVPVLHIPKMNLVGTDPQQIIDTAKYYRDERGQIQANIPERDDIWKVDKLNVLCAFPLMRTDHFIDAEVAPGFTFQINANAFDYMKNLGKDYERLRRGALYKFETVEAFGLWFLPKEVMEGLKNHDWNQHLRQINIWMAQREEILDEGVRRGHIVRPDGPKRNLFS